MNETNQDQHPTDEHLSLAAVPPPAMPALIAPDERTVPLFSPDETKELRSRWITAQGTFVDEPRQAVQQADSLVAATMQRLADIFAKEREKLDKQWDSDATVSTEDLRLALRQYRSFFDRLLSI